MTMFIHITSWTLTAKAGRVMCVFSKVCQHLIITGHRSAHGEARTQNIAARNPITYAERKRFPNFIDCVRCPGCAYVVPHGSCCHWGAGGCKAVFQISVPDLTNQQESERLPNGPGLRSLDLIRLPLHFSERDSKINHHAKNH